MATPPAVGPTRNSSSPLDIANLPNVRSALAGEIDKKLAGSPMQGTGAVFVEAANANDINPWFLVAIAGHESNFGRLGFATNGSRNAFGMGVTGAPGAGIRYPTWADGIRGAANNLGGPLYKGAGKFTIKDIGARWAADKKWPEKVAAKMTELSGAANDVDHVVIGPRRTLPNDETTRGSIIDRVGELSPIAGLTDVLKFISDPGTWIRIGGMILGAAIMIVGIVMVVRSSDAGRPIGLALASVGFVWLYGSVKAINPADLLKSLVGA